MYGARWSTPGAGRPGDRMMQQTRAVSLNARGRWLRMLLVGAMALACLPVHAQVQRSFVNPGFEVPGLPGTACWSIRESADVPGWETTEPPYSGSWGSNEHGTCGGHPDRPVIGGLQIFKDGWTDSGHGAVPAVEGEQWAELNAFTRQRLYQTVCMANGERVDWSLAHRGRGGTQVMQFNIGPNADGNNARPIIQARSSMDGGSIDSCTLGDCSYDGVDSTWSRYSGSFIWDGASGMQTIGFQSLTTGSSGNYLDDIQLTLRPYIEFHPAASTTLESAGSAGVPSLRVAGVIDVTLNVTVQVVGGTAVLGTDFSAPGASFIVTIPAGDYGSGEDFPLPLEAIDNALVQDNRTVALEIFEDPENYAIGNTAVCGEPANAQVVWTIVDDDADLAVTKEVEDGGPAADGSIEYTVTFLNNTARPTLGPLDAHDAVAAVEDLEPAGISFDSWSCQASNGASCPGGAVDGSVTGSGPITGDAILPAGDGAAGGRLVYSVIASFDDPQSCDAVTNTASVTTPVGLHEGDGVGGGFVTPAPGGSANNSAAADAQPMCADLSIVKTVSPEEVAPGGGVTYTLEVSNGGPVAADGAIVTDPGVAGSLECTALACSAQGGAVCPASPTAGQLLAGLVIPTFPAGSAVTLELGCTVTATGQ